MNTPTEEQYWVKHPLILESENIMLVPLEEKYFDALYQTATDEIIWQYMPVKGYIQDILFEALHDALIKRKSGEQYPFLIFHKGENKIIGSTRLLKLNREHRNLEIGYTWFQRDYWGKGWNEECKLLLLSYCFEQLKTIRVQIIAADKNLRSRNAILRIGATFEGVLREVLLRDGNKRSVAYYSILEEEWNSVKKHLTQLVHDRQSKKV